MLRYLGWTEAADLVLKGVKGAIRNKQLTYDLARARAGKRLIRVKNKDKNKPVDVKEEITKLTDGRGADIAIEASGMTQVIESTLPLLKTMGQLILLGTPRAPYMTDATAMYRQTHDGACITVKGASEWRYPVKHEQFVKRSMERNSRIVMELLDSGKLNAAPLLTHLLPPEQAAAAYEGVRNDRESYFGVIFDWTK